MPSGVRHSVRGVRRRILEVPFSDLAEPFAILLSDELTKKPKTPWPKKPRTRRRNRTSGFHQHLRPHAQAVKGLNKAPLVEGRGLQPCAGP
jgi:hypothetical protein